MERKKHVRLTILYLEFIHHPNHFIYVIAHADVHDNFMEMRLFRRRARLTMYTDISGRYRAIIVNTEVACRRLAECHTIVSAVTVQAAGRDESTQQA